MVKSNVTSGGTQPFIPAQLSGLMQRGSGGILPERGSRQQYDLVSGLLQNAMSGAQQSQSPLLALLAPAVTGAIGSRTENLYKTAQGERDNAAMDTLLASMGGGAPSMPARAPANSAPVASTGDPIRDGIIQTAQALQMDPMDLATTISYETAGTFDPRKAGPTTQWGQHQGLIQFGEPQALEYGADFSSEEAALASQFGENGAIANYFRKNGYQPGMGLLDVYSIVNAGGPGRYNASDANNGGAPGSVADKVNNQMSEHRANAQRLLGGDFTSTGFANAGVQPRMGNNDLRALMGLVNNQDVSEPLRDLASSMLSDGMNRGQPNSPRDQVNLAQQLFGLEQAMQPRQPQQRQIRSDQNGVDRYVDTGEPVFPEVQADPGQTSSNDAGVQRQTNEATTMITSAIANAESRGMTRQEAVAAVANDPIYGPQFRMLGIDPASLIQNQPEQSGQPQVQSPGFFSRLFGGSDQPMTTGPAQPAVPQVMNDPLGLR